MTFTKGLTILGVCSGLCFAVWLTVVLAMNPADGPVVVLLFYVSIGLALIGSFYFFGFLFRAAVLRKEEVAERGMKIAWRQALFLALLAVGALILQSQRWLTWLNFCVLLGIALAMEFMFVVKKRSGRIG